MCLIYHLISHLGICGKLAFLHFLPYEELARAMSQKLTDPFVLSWCKRTEWMIADKHSGECRSLVFIYNLAICLSVLFKPEVQVRQVAVKFASTVFPPDHIPSRYLLLLAAGDP